MTHTKLHRAAALVSSAFVVLGSAALATDARADQRTDRVDRVDRLQYRAAEDIDTDYGRLLLLLDSSGSMKEPAGGGVTKIVAARTALTTVIDNLPDDADVGLRVFGATVFSRNDAGACEDTQLVVEPGTGNRAELRDAVASYKPYGETPIPAALTAAAADLGGEGKRSIVLVSDGESTCAPDPCEVAAKIAEQGIDLQIDVVGLSVEGKARQQLRCIAEKGNGTYYDADDAEELTESLERISDRAVQPFVAEGQDVDGTPSPTGAPAISAGVWRDETPSREEIRHYRIERQIPGSTLWVGVVSQVDQRHQLKAELLTSNGDGCGSGFDFNAVRGQGSAELIGVAVNSRSDDTCTEPDGLDLAVSATNWSEGSTEAPMQITVLEEPPLASRDGLVPAEKWNVAQEWEDTGLDGEQPADVVFGSTLADAPVLEKGVYNGGIVPGEAQLFRVRLEWGESLQTRLVLPVNPAAWDLYGWNGPVIRMHVLSPVGGEVSTSLTLKDKDGNALLGHASPPTRAESGESYAHTRTPSVRYLNRDASNVETAAIPGDYYVMITQERTSDGDSLITPFHLEVATVGTAGEGAPDYVDGDDIVSQPADRSADEADAGAVDGSSAAQRRSPDEGGGTLKLVAGGGAIGLGVVGVIAALLLLRRRRATS